MLVVDHKIKSIKDQKGKKDGSRALRMADKNKNELKSKREKRKRA